MLDGPYTNPKRITCSEGKPVDCHILTEALIGRDRNWRLNPEALVEAANQKVEILYFANLTFKIQHLPQCKALELYCLNFNPLLL